MSSEIKVWEAITKLQRDMIKVNIVIVVLALLLVVHLFGGIAHAQEPTLWRNYSDSNQWFREAGPNTLDDSWSAYPLDIIISEEEPPYQFLDYQVRTVMVGSVSGVAIEDPDGTMRIVIETPIFGMMAQYEGFGGLSFEAYDNVLDGNLLHATGPIGGGGAAGYMANVAHQYVIIRSSFGAVTIDALSSALEALGPNNEITQCGRTGAYPRVALVWMLQVDAVPQLGVTDELGCVGFDVPVNDIPYNTFSMDFWGGPAAARAFMQRLLMSLDAAPEE